MIPLFNNDRYNQDGNELDTWLTPYLKAIVKHCVDSDYSLRDAEQITTQYLAVLFAEARLSKGSLDKKQKDVV